MEINNNAVNEVETNDLKEYKQKRKDYMYYRYLKSLLTILCREEDSILDVGSRGIDMLSFLPCRTKKSIDLEYPYSDDETEGIIGNYFDYHPEKLDIITCFQVLEHKQDNEVGVFAKKLLNDARMAVVSVPYMWPKEQCKWHVQDPIDVDKIISWFGKNPVYLHTVTEKTNVDRIIVVFLEGCNPDIDLEWWREDARKTAERRKGKPTQERKSLLTNLRKKVF